MWCPSQFDTMDLMYDDVSDVLLISWQTESSALSF